MKIKLRKDETLETDDYSVAQLELLARQVAERALACDEQIDHAKLRQVETGEFLDRQRWHNLKLARRRLGHARQELAQEIARRRRAERQEDNVQWELPKHFIKVAKERLSDRIFEQLMAEAMRRYANTHQGAETLANYVFEVGE